MAFYARNDHLGLLIPYEYVDIDHSYEPDFLVRLVNGVTIVMEIKGFEDDQDKAKHTAAKRWVTAVNNWGECNNSATPPAAPGQRVGSGPRFHSRSGSFCVRNDFASRLMPH